jgi:hypothetical protein
MSSAAWLLCVLLLPLLSTSCRDGWSDQPRLAEQAAAAAEAAADAADAAAAMPASGGNAAALERMSVGHIVGETTAELSLASLINLPSPPRPNAPAATSEQAMLAYEHQVDIRLDATRIPGKLQRLRMACESAKYGACLVLQVSQRGGRYAQGSLQMRAEQRAIEPLIVTAGEGGDIGERRTRAEDLAVAVRDNTLLRDRLRKQHERLLQFQGRSDLKVADVIALSEQLSKVEAELEAAEREGAVHRRRIESQLLTIEFSPFAREEQRGEIVAALRDSGDLMAASVGAVIRVAAGLLPVLVALIATFWLLRKLWRFARRRKAAESH